MLREKMSNIYYFKHINSLGGIETFFYELAKKYQDYDLTIYYKTGDAKQIKRLKQYVRCIQYKGEEIECEKAFFNFNMEIADKVKAKEKTLIIHGNYKDLKSIPSGWEQMDRIVAVSNDSAKAFEEITGRKVEVCYNPYTKKELNPVINCVVASRLADKCKGNDLLNKLIIKMDEYCIDHNRHYNMLVFSDIKSNISENVIYKKPILDIEPYLASADFVIQLSKTEGFGYTTCIAQTYGTKCVLTPCPVYKELGITNAIWLNFDLSNIDEVVEKIFNESYEKKPFTLPKDRWDELLEESKSNYKEEQMKNYNVKALLQFTDTEENKLRKAGDTFKVNKERYEYLSGNNKNKIVAVELIEIDKPTEKVEKVSVDVKKENKLKKEVKPKKNIKKK